MPRPPRRSDGEHEEDDEGDRARDDHLDEVGAFEGRAQDERGRGDRQR